METHRKKIKPSEKPHYVNNAKFSYAVVEYVKEVEEAKKNDKPLPIVPDYIAECFMKITQGLSHSPNFIRYSFRDEMVMDAVENCLKAVTNYDITHYTRTGKPNAFSYFTQISYYAFLRRIAKEKKQQDIKIKYTMHGNICDFMAGNMDEETSRIIESYVNILKSQMDDNKEKSFNEEKVKDNKPKNNKLYEEDSDLGKLFL